MHYYPSHLKLPFCDFVTVMKMVLFSDLKYSGSSQTQISTCFKCSKENGRDEQLAYQAGTEELLSLFFIRSSPCWWIAFLSYQSMPFALITFMRIHSTY